MPVSELDLTIYRGDTYTHRLIWKGADGQPVDLTGYTARLHVKQKPDSTDVTLELTDPDGLVIDGLNGTVDIVITAAESRIDRKSSVYDMEMTSPAGEVTTLVRGKFTVEPDVTRV